ncbi:fork-head domain-containing protein [Nephila pilipes]|uniref:Fork-head domain-containing protein n=1 Tax=Nephila pilipes TaxID=299642 RepID=A0A8X6Q0H5_NEPPI|nr:fork-head domain-containing protein [Nephila pilipes]
MERRRKPTVINLREHLHNTSSKTTATIIQHAGQAVESSSHLSQALENCKTSESLSMLSEPDKELSNDFKWLIDFDLKTVFLYDIEGNDNELEYNQDVSESFVSDRERFTNFKESSSEQKRKILQKSKQNITQSLKSIKYTPYTYAEIILRCLNEIGEVSVKTIYKWISDTFPDFKPSDITWKNAIRHTLTVNPLFQKKKLDLGKCHVWYLDKTSNNYNEKDILQPFDLENYMNPRQKKSRKQSKPGNKKRNTHKLSSKEIMVLNAENTSYSNIYLTSSENHNELSLDEYQQKYDAENWIVTTLETHDYQNLNSTEAAYVSKNDHEEYFNHEIQTAASFSVDTANYTEPREVKYLLDETAASIPVQIIQEKSL